MTRTAHIIGSTLLLSVMLFLGGWTEYQYGKHAADRWYAAHPIKRDLDFSHPTLQELTSFPSDAAIFHGWLVTGDCVSLESTRWLFRHVDQERAAKMTISGNEFDNREGGPCSIEPLYGSRVNPRKKP